MTNRVDVFRLLKGVLTEGDLDYLKRASQAHLGRENPIPCYALLDCLESKPLKKIRGLIENEIGSRPYYLNDFYFYSDGAFGAHWHIDTELFTFDECLNAWMLLSPHRVVNPLAFIGDLNDSAENYYHSMKEEDADGVFFNYCSRRRESRPLSAIESKKLGTPAVKAGDILLINPRRFHKTNTTVPKHAMVIKFAIKGENGFLSRTQVPAMFWPEVGMFNRMLESAGDWDSFLAALKEKLATPEGRKALSAGFYPEKTGLYKKMVAAL